MQDIGNLNSNNIIASTTDVPYALDENGYFYYQDSDGKYYPTAETMAYYQPGVKTIQTNIDPNKYPGNLTYYSSNIPYRAIGKNRYRALSNNPVTTTAESASTQESPENESSQNTNIDYSAWLKNFQDNPGLLGNAYVYPTKRINATPTIYDAGAIAGLSLKDAVDQAANGGQTALHGVNRIVNSFIDPVTSSGSLANDFLSYINRAGWGLLGGGADIINGIIQFGTSPVTGVIGSGGMQLLGKGLSIASPGKWTNMIASAIQDDSDKKIGLFDDNNQGFADPRFNYFVGPYGGDLQKVSDLFTLSKLPKVINKGYKSGKQYVENVVNRYKETKRAPLNNVDDIHVKEGNTIFEPGATPKDTPAGMVRYFNAKGQRHAREISNEEAAVLAQEGIQNAKYTTDPGIVVGKAINSKNEANPTLELHQNNQAYYDGDLNFLASKTRPLTVMKQVATVFNKLPDNIGISSSIGARPVWMANLPPLARMRYITTGKLPVTNNYIPTNYSTSIFGEMSRNQARGKGYMQKSVTTRLNGTNDLGMDGAEVRQYFSQADPADYILPFDKMTDGELNSWNAEMANKTGMYIDPKTRTADHYMFITGKKPAEFTISKDYLYFPYASAALAVTNSTNNDNK